MKQLVRSRVVRVVVMGAALTVPFWPELWQGGAFLGGDLTTFFLPQKTYLSDSLARGDLPFWNNLVGHGYSFVGDSQIAMWYPTTLPLYGLLDVNTAINATVLIHYVLAFSLAWLFAWWCGLRRLGCLLTAVVFTYGYFPARIGYEWAITTGAWLPLGWACLEAYLRTDRKRWLVLLLAGLTCQLLAGHFNHALITHVWLAAVAFVRTTIARRRSDAVRVPASKTLALIAACQVTAFALAAVQLLPTWELRQFSERRELPIPNVSYGRIPPWYLKQLLAPWDTYTEDPNARGGPATNPVSAQLYLGLMTVPLLFVGLWKIIRRRLVMLTYAAAASVGLVFAVGWVTPIYQHLPGFGWFKGPAQYAIVFALGGAMIAGTGLDHLRARIRLWQRHRKGARARRQTAVAHWILMTVLFLVLWFDLRAVGRAVTFSIPVQGSVAALRFPSRLTEQLKSYDGEPRLLAPMHNTISALGIGVVPGYLGMQPRAYVNESTAIPHGWPVDSPPKPGQLSWLRRNGVTHLLFMEQEPIQDWLDEMELDDSSVKVIFGDNFLTSTFTRSRPFYLVPVSGTRGRIAWQEPAAGNTAELDLYLPDEVEATVASKRGGTIVLTDFAYPGWNVSVDGSAAKSIVVEGMHRGVRVPSGQHKLRWEYRPNSIIAGAAVSLLTFIGVIVVLLLYRRRRKLAA